MKRLSLILLISLTILCNAFAVQAIWDPSYGSFVISEGDIFPIGVHSIKVTEVIAEEGLIFVQVRRAGQVIAADYLTLDEPFELENIVRLELLSLETYPREQGTIKIMPWVDGAFGFYNFPEQLHLDDRYETYFDVRNIGAEAAIFRVEIVEEGRGIRYGRTYETPEHQSLLSLLDIQIPVKLIAISPSLIERVRFHVAANRRQPASGGTGLFREGAVLINLYYGNALLDTIRIPRVKVSISPKQGFIQEVRLPPVMLQDVEYYALTTLQNSGLLQTGVLSDKLHFRLLPNENVKMIPELLSDEIPAHLTARWQFKLRAKNPGVHEITFEFSHNDPFTGKKTLFDTFTTAVNVIPGFSTRVAELNAPSSVNLGENIPLEVVIHNVGGERRLNMIIESPTLLEIPLQRDITLAPLQDSRSNFNIEAIYPGPNVISVNLYEKTGSKWNINFNPYSEGELFSSQQVIVNVIDPFEVIPVAPTPALVVPLTPVVEPEPVSVPVEQPPVQPPVYTPQPAFLDANKDLILVILATLAVLALLFGVRVLMNHSE